MNDVPLHRAKSRLGVCTTTGSDGCETLLPERATDDLTRYVLRWTVKASGRRPRDYIGRDLLFGSLGRDYRPRLYHQLCRTPPDWVIAPSGNACNRVEGLKPGVIRRHLVLRFLHETHLAGLADHARGRLGQSQHDLLNALYACPPAGLELSWDEDDFGERDDYLPCDNARVCPWCHVRRVLALYDRLFAGPCDPGPAGNKLLVMVKVRVDDPADHHGETGLTRKHVTGVQRAWKPRLMEYGRRLGVTGGLTGYQVGPFRSGGKGGQRSFRHELSLLGEVDVETGGKFDRARLETIRSSAGFSAGPDEQPFLRGREHTSTQGVPAEVTMMRMADRKALRWLLAGSAAHRMWGDPAFARIERNEAARTHEGSLGVRKGLGVDGALALQPTFLFTPGQFWSFVDALRGRHLYSPFGSWVRHSGAAGRAGVTESEIGPLTGTGSGAISAACDARRDADGLDLLIRARPVYEAVSQELGRAPGRQILARELARAGIEVTRRQAVVLVKRLRPPAAVSGTVTR